MCKYKDSCKVGKTTLKYKIHLGRFACIVIIGHLLLHDKKEYFKCEMEKSWMHHSFKDKLIKRKEGCTHHHLKIHLLGYDKLVLYISCVFPGNMEWRAAKEPSTILVLIVEKFRKCETY